MLNFEKYQGTGNDFIIINGLEETIDDPSVLAKSICDRHFGVGADGLMIVRKKENDFYMEFYNADGTIAPMCGNGIRCFASYLFNHQLINDKSFIIKTLAGDMLVDLSINYQEIESVKINMGKPQMISLNQEINVLDKKVFMSVLTVGTLHGVIFVEHLDEYPIKELAPLIESHPLFPQHINVNFCEVIDQNHLKVVTYERGVGFTKSCGTGSSASAVVSSIVKKTDKLIHVSVPGGNLVIEQKNQDVYLLGPATFICSGNYKEVKKNG